MTKEQIDQLADRIMLKVASFIEAPDCASRSEAERQALDEDVGYSFYCTGCGEGTDCDRHGISLYLKSEVIKKIVIEELQKNNS